MKKKFAVLLAMLMLMSVVLTTAVAIDFTPVQDNAGALSQDTVDMIYNANEQVYAASGGQIFVATDRYLPDGWQYADDYANQLFNDTGIGNANKNNGILLYFTTQDNKIWLVGGSGIKSFNAESLLEKYFYDKYDNNDYDGAVQKLIPQLVKVYGISYKSSASSNGVSGGNVSGSAIKQVGGGSGTAIFWVFVVIVLLVIFIAMAFSRRTRYMQSPYYVRTDPRPSWLWFIPGFYMGSRFNRPYYYNYRRTVTPPRPQAPRQNNSVFGNSRPSGTSSRPSSSSYFSGGMGGRSSGGGAGRSGSGISGFGGSSRSGSSGFGGGRSGGGFSGGGGGRSSGGGGGRR